MYVYQQAEGSRHLRWSEIPTSLETGDCFRALCGDECVVAARDDHHRPGVVWLDRGCTVCESRWTQLTDKRVSA